MHSNEPRDLMPGRMVGGLVRLNLAAIKLEFHQRIMIVPIDAPKQGLHYVPQAFVNWKDVQIVFTDLLGSAIY